MTDYALVTDSTATIPDELVKKFNISVAPQIVIFGEEVLKDGIDLTANEFYDRLQHSDVHPTTSQATPATFKKLFDPFVAEGKPILVMVVSSKLSGTIQSAEQAKSEYPDAEIEIVDSKAVAMALGFQVLAVARAREAGLSFQEALSMARSASEKTGVFFFVDTLEYLHRGGRIGGAQKFVGTALNIKPILEIQDGAIEALERVRTNSKALARLLEILQERVDGHDNIRLATMHAATPDVARELLDEAEKLVNPIEGFVTDASPSIGVHTGPGTIGIIYSVDY